MKVVVALFGLVVAALAQDASTSSYTGPMFDPDTAPFFGPSTIVYPSVTESAPVLSNLPTLTPSGSSATISLSSSAMANSTLSTSTLSRNSTTSHTSTHSSTHSFTSVRTSRTATPTADETSPSASVPAETGAGVANYPEAFGAIVGGLLAGLAML
ncbi:hypothetical protein BKA58DRAFT_137921 [Alternaria rosae]|uniref:uncharacterized protein n=1 Tax=Alternaria rosae TaxID=1187941 RepID=UPI001E8E81D8|nr:uncharacterized protein BKA58DRAFT_137921 [Alternaria rosae]KAH6876247.1 hypothetical protein BKA58DRAFT_137921 [Alternaria rosae]